MDVLIKGLEAPKEEDWINLRIDADGKVVNYDGKDTTWIPVPDHNDLADKSVIIERMGDAHDELWDKVDEKALSECHVAFLKAVMYAPTVVPSSESTVGISEHGDLINKDTLRKAFENQIANGSITVMDIFRIIDEAEVVLGRT